ncbi:hypothetical protein G3I01_07935 [Gramella sp. MT6]|uniref:hypothetical protein n=1 Tax=Gramella sp. MT6 TaxID=2705471 RepID=UPI001C5E88E2|nr:hypothetical protein [Gramella sp. MT6]QYA25440.1 hypothetical protein G3I01_07935 [Gramella sp. MT6]
MAPIKFEEHVKEKLDEREIQPSAGSWDKLSSRLDESEKSSGRKLWISAIAAVVVLLIASTLFIDQQQQNTFPVVSNPAEEANDVNKNKISVNEPVQVASEEKAEKRVQEDKRSEIMDPGPVEKEQKVAESTTLKKAEKLEEDISKSSSERQLVEPISIEPAVIVENSSTELSAKVQEVLQKIKNEQEQSGDLTNAEVDALLAEAAIEISNQRNLYSENAVSADALLADVEYEVDQSFRKEVFDFLKEEFLKAKTAVATRNE